MIYFAIEAGGRAGDRRRPHVGGGEEGGKIRTRPPTDKPLAKTSMFSVRLLARERGVPPTRVALHRISGMHETQKTQDSAHGCRSLPTPHHEKKKGRSLAAFQLDSAVTIKYMGFHSDLYHRKSPSLVTFSPVERALASKPRIARATVSRNRPCETLTPAPNCTPSPT